MLKYDGTLEEGVKHAASEEFVDKPDLQDLLDFCCVDCSGHWLITILAFVVFTPV
jgi:hypothetical protein